MPARSTLGTPHPLPCQCQGKGERNLVVGQRLSSSITCSGESPKSTNHTVLQAQLLQWLSEQVRLEVTGTVFGLWEQKYLESLNCGHLVV